MLDIVGSGFSLERKPAPKTDLYRDRDFANTYTGYDEGINVDGLDSTANWQFDLN